jgi:tetratricopeptide (TPR) repeat protein
MAYFWGNEDYSSAGDNFLFTAKLYEGKDEHDEECLWNAAASYRFGSTEVEAARWAEKINQVEGELTVEQQREKVPSANPKNALPEVCQKFVYASREYGRTFREGNPEQEHHLEDMYYWEGTLMMAFDCYDSGRDALARIVDLEYVPAYDESIDVKSRARIAMMIGESWFDQHYYRKSAEWFRKAASLADVGCELEEKALANAASADFTSMAINEPIYELAEDEELPPEIREQLVASAEGYLQVGRDNLNQPDVAVNAFKKAGSIYASQLMDYENAALAYHELAENYPDHPDVDEVLFSEALSYYKLEQWGRAAVVFESILTNSVTGTPQEPIALFTSGECYENLKNWDNAARVFIRYGEDYREGGSPDGVIDSFFRAGHAYIKLGDDITGREYLVRCTEEYEYYNAQPGIEVSYDNPAKAYMEIGNLLFEEYLKIEISGDFFELLEENSPLIQKSARKLTMMNELVEIYGRCAKAADLEINFGGRFMAGQVYENFYTAMTGMDIRVDGLEALPLDQQEMYYEALDTVMVQFEEMARANGQDQAVNVYEYILMTASEHGEDNKWVDKARERLVDLVPDMYMQYAPIGTRQGVDRRGATIWELVGMRIYSEYINIAGMAPVAPVYDDIPVDDGPTEFPLYDKFGEALYDEVGNPLMNTGGWEAVYDSTGNPLLDAAGQPVFNDSNNTTDLFTEMGLPAYESAGSGGDSSVFPLYDKFGEALYDEASQPLMNTGGWEAVYDKFGEPLLDAAGEPVFNDPNNSPDLFTEMGLPAYGGGDTSYDDTSYDDTTYDDVTDPPLDDTTDDGTSDDTTDDGTADSASGGTRQAYDRLGYPLFDSAGNPLYDTAGGEEVYDEFGNPLLDDMGVMVTNVAGSPDLYDENGELLYP